ncbi:hypothetical protein [Sulfitobacter indolifex]|uniref:hypothetical protein n=1 Tax=Sulfitobacter indolifex TaxID=225422 RepID=UPI001050E773|nr:hypothetical protein [Sulfitobacter indolifex]
MAKTKSIAVYNCDPEDVITDDMLCDGCGQYPWECVECGMMPDGQCLLAGTEHCDWGCGALNDQRIDAMKASQPES